MTPRPRLKVVVDTNVFVSGTVFRRGMPFEVLEAWRARRFMLVTSPQLCQEIDEVLRRSEFQTRYGLSREEVSQVRHLLDSDGLSISPIESAPIEVRDPKDQHVLSLALTADVDYLVSGDQDLLALAGDTRVGDLQIVTPRAFVERLGRDQD